MWRATSNQVAPSLPCCVVGRSCEIEGLIFPRLPNFRFTVARVRLACWAAVVALQHAGPLSAYELLPAAPV